MSCGHGFRANPGLFAHDTTEPTLYYPLDDNESFGLGDGMTCIICDQPGTITALYDDTPIITSSGRILLP